MAQAILILSTLNHLKTKNLLLVPSFLENDPDGSFRNFEKTAEHF